MIIDEETEPLDDYIEESVSENHIQVQEKITEDLFEEPQLEQTQTLESTEITEPKTPFYNILERAPTGLDIEKPLQEQESRDTDSLGLLDKLSEVKIPLLIIIIASILLGALGGNYLITNNQLMNLQLRYDSIVEYYTDLSNEHNELRIQYQETLVNNTRLIGEKVALTQINQELTQELEEILNYEKNVYLETERTIALSPHSNQTIIYEIPFNGFITLNYTATSDIYILIGSSSLNNTYYSRIPEAPNGQSNGTITIPVQPNLIILFANEAQTLPVEIIYQLTFIY